MYMRLHVERTTEYCFMSNLEEEYSLLCMYESSVCVTGVATGCTSRGKRAVLQITHERLQVCISPFLQPSPVSPTPLQFKSRIFKIDIDADGSRILLPILGVIW
jgi:hypothetical protein